MRLPPAGSPLPFAASVPLRRHVAAVLDTRLGPLPVVPVVVMAPGPAAADATMAVAVAAGGGGVHGAVDGHFDAVDEEEAEAHEKLGERIVLVCKRERRMNRAEKENSTDVAIVTVFTVLCLFCGTLGNSICVCLAAASEI